MHDALFVLATGKPHKVEKKLWETVIYLHIRILYIDTKMLWLNVIILSYPKNISAVKKGEAEKMQVTK